MGKRISTYTVDSIVAGNDKWIGTDASDGNATMNFTPDGLALYYIMNGLADPSQSSLTYIYQNPNTDNKGVFTATLDGTNPESLDLATLQEIYISKLDMNRTDQSLMLEYINGSNIKITRARASNDGNPIFDVAYGLYTLSLTETLDDYFRFSLQPATLSDGEGTVIFTADNQGVVPLGDSIAVSIVASGSGGGSGLTPIILEGSAAPQDSQGKVGDLYIQKTGTDVFLYGPKDINGWGTGIYLNGVNGNHGVHGTGVTASVDADGVLTVTTTTYDENNTPTVTDETYNILGPKGNTGASGRTLLNGIVNPTAGIGDAGDFYINTVTNTIFGPKEGASDWGTGTLIKGDKGDTGENGTPGLQGVQGHQGQFDFEVYRVEDHGVTPGKPIGGDYNETTGTFTDPADWTHAVPTYDTETETLWESRTHINPLTYITGDTLSWSQPFHAGTIGPKGDPGDGYSGAAVDSNGNLSITGTGNNPDVGPVNVRGPQGNIGEALKVDGYTVVTGANPGTTVNLETATTETSAGSFFVEKGDTGEAGKAGSQIYISTEAPETGDHEEGDWVVVNNEDGLTLWGPQSTGGTYTEHQLSGSTILSGTGAPANTLGVNGDFYLDLNGDIFYGPKIAGVWPPSGTHLIGPQGEQGRFQVSIYRLSAGTPDTPDSTTFNVTDETDEGYVPTGWTKNPQTQSGTLKLYESRATINPADTVGGNVTAVWSAPFEAGSAGPAGNGILSITILNLTDPVVLPNGTFGDGDVEVVITEDDGTITRFGIESGEGTPGAQGFYTVFINIDSATDPGTPVGIAGIENPPAGGWEFAQDFNPGVNDTWQSATVYDPANPDAVLVWSAPYVASGSQGQQGIPGIQGERGPAGESYIFPNATTQTGDGNVEFRVDPIADGDDSVYGFIDLSSYTPLTPSTGGGTPTTLHMYTKVVTSVPTSFNITDGTFTDNGEAHHQQSFHLTFVEDDNLGVVIIPSDLFPTGKPTIQLNGSFNLDPDNITQITTGTTGYRGFYFPFNESVTVTIHV